MAMQCPQCNRPVRSQADGHGGTLFYCPECGWGMDRLREAATRDLYEERASGPGAGVYIGLAAGWLFSLALVVGPYVAIWIYWPNPPIWVHPAYWIVMLAYIVFSADHTPDYDSSNLGWAGGLIDNPFSWEDDMNRFGLGVAIVTLPGKLVGWTVQMSWRLVRGK